MVFPTIFVMERTTILCLAILSLFFAACCSDDDNNPIATCMQGLGYFTKPASEVEDTTLFCFDCQIDCQEVYSSAIPFDYFYPCFNPNNPDQLAYYRYDNTLMGIGYELWVADFCTGGQKKLADNAFYSLDWSTKGWLIFTATDQNIWKIKSDGDSLTQMTTSGSYNQYPKWSPNADKFAYRTEVDTGYHFLIVSHDGMPLDTINELSRASCWHWIDEDKICYAIDYFSLKLNYIEIGSGEIIHLHTLSNQSSNDGLVRSISLLPNENAIVWLARGLIGKTNLTDGSFEILKERLQQEKYETQLTVRPGSNEVVFDKGVVHEVDHCHVDTEYDFYVIEKDGTNQRKILIPE